MSQPKHIFPLFIAEFAGTAILLAAGLSIVIALWGDGSTLARYLPDLGLRRAVNGFLFGCVGCLVALSPVGKISGAHINPAVSLGFWLRRKMKTNAMIGYIISQCAGAILGCLPLLLWKHQGQSI